MKTQTRVWGLLLPTWLVLGALFVAPLAIMLVVSLAETGSYGRIRWTFSPVNYLQSIEGSSLMIYWRSLWIALITTALCLAVSYPAAYYIARVARQERKNLLLALVVVPFWTSFLLRTYAWMFILRKEGVLNAVLLATGLIHEPLEILYTPTAVMIGQLYGELPFMILPLYASLEKLDGTLLEAARDLGATARGAFWRVTIPQTMPGIVAGVVLVFIPSLGAFITPDMLGGSQKMLVGNWIQNQFSSALNTPLGSAVAMGLSAFVLLLLWSYAAWARRRGEEMAI